MISGSAGLDVLLERREFRGQPELLVFASSAPALHAAWAQAHLHMSQRQMLEVTWIHTLVVPRPLTKRGVYRSKAPRGGLKVASERPLVFAYLGHVQPSSTLLTTTKLTSGYLSLGKKPLQNVCRIGGTRGGWGFDGEKYAEGLQYLHPARWKLFQLNALRGRLRPG